MEHRYKLSLFFLGLVLLFAGCGPKVYETNTSFEQTLLYNRKLVAILPLEVSSQGDNSVDEAAYNNKQQAYIVQRMMSDALLDQFSKKRYSIDFQDINKTNAILRSNQISYEELASREKAELCRLLGVDAVLSGTIRSSVPLLDGNSETVIGIDPRRAFPNRTTVALTIHEQGEGKLLWRYDYKTPSVVGNKIQSLMSVVMKNVASKFPYLKK